MPENTVQQSSVREKTVQRDPRQRDRGFTLTEVIIVVVIIGIISVAIGSVFSVIVRTTPSTEARADDARSLLGLSTWLPPDVNSTPKTPTGSVDAEGAAFDRRPTAGTTCSSGNDGTNLLKLRWTETISGTVRYDVSYRLAERPAGWQIIRVSCTNGGAPSVINLTAGLPPVAATPTLENKGPVNVTYKVDDGRVVGVVFLVTTVDGEQVRIDSVSQSPNETLAPIGTVVLDPTTTTEETTTTTTEAPSAVGVCSLLTSVSGVDLIPTPDVPLLRDGTDLASGELTSEVEVGAGLRYSISEELSTLDLAVQTCATLQLVYETGTSVIGRPASVEATCTDTDGGEPELCLELTVVATVQLPADPTEQWTTAMPPDPPHPVHLAGPGGVVIAGTETGFFVDVDPTTVPVTCTASFVSVSPNPVFNTNNANSNNTNNVSSGPLRDPVTVTVSKGDNCGNLGLEYLHDPPSIGWKAFGASSQVILERVNNENWTDGNRTLRLRDGQTGTILAETTLTIN